MFVIALDGLKVWNKVDKYVWCLVGLFFITISRTLAIVGAIGFNGFAIGYAGAANGFAGIANGFEGVANGFAGVVIAFVCVAIGNVYCTFSNLCSVIEKVCIANARQRGVQALVQIHIHPVLLCLSFLLKGLRLRLTYSFSFDMYFWLCSHCCGHTLQMCASGGKFK